jgi:DNA-binding NarL/FixJ family response regulator
MSPARSRRRAGLLCVEDDELVGRALTTSLSRKIGVDWAMSIAEGKRLLGKHDYLGCMLDVELPDGSGLDLLGWIRQERMDLPALVMTGHSDRMLVNRATVFGAEFAFKPDLFASVHAFVDRIVLARGTGGVVPTVAADRFASELGMTTRERDVLRLLAAGVSREALATELHVTKSTIDSTVSRLLRRTGKRSLDEVLRAILEISATPIAGP